MRPSHIVWVSSFCLLPTALAGREASNHGKAESSIGSASSQTITKDQAKEIARKDSNVYVNNMFLSPPLDHNDEKNRIHTVWDQFKGGHHHPAERFSESTLYDEPRLRTNSMPHHHLHEPLVPRPGKIATYRNQGNDELKLAEPEEIMRAKQAAARSRQEATNSKKFGPKIKAFGKTLKQKLKPAKLAPIRPLLRRRSQDLDLLKLQSLRRRQELSATPGLMRRRLHTANEYLG